MKNIIEPYKISKKKSIGDKIADYCRRRNWTQLELSIRTGITRDQISRIESGKCKPKLDTLKRIEDALQLPGWVLLDDRNVIDESGDSFLHKRSEIILHLQSELHQRDLSVNELQIVESVALSTADALIMNRPDR